MQDLFIEFLPPWVETGLQPAFYDRESGTVLQQTARMYAKVNELVKAVNGMDKVIKEYVDYIDNYFKNLDVQEEINNKLDDMADKGELTSYIAQFLAVSPVFAFETISDMADATNLVAGCIARVIGNTSASDGDGAYYIVRAIEPGETADGVIKVAIGDELIADRIEEKATLDIAKLDDEINGECKINFVYRGNDGGSCRFIQAGGKNILFDFGVQSYVPNLLTYLKSKNISKIDYVIISHYHSDHVGGNSGEGVITFLADTYFDFSTTKFILPHKNINWTTLADYVDNASVMHGAETAIKTALTSAGIEYEEPDDGDELEIDDFTSFKFNNIGDTYYTHYYTAGLYNNFSMLVTLTHNDKKVLITSDCEELAQKWNVDNVDYADVVTAPHHDLNAYSDKNFLRKLNASVEVIEDLFDQNDNDLLNNLGVSTMFSGFLRTIGCDVYASNQSGEIEVTIKGNNITVKADNGCLGTQSNIATYSGGVELSIGDDIDDLKQVGSYHAVNAVASTLLHLPIGYGDPGPVRITNTQIAPFSGQITQTMQTARTVLVRQLRNATDWSDWVEVFNYGLGLIPNLIPDNSDADDYVLPGKYYVNGGTNYTTIAHFPDDGGGSNALLIVMKGRPTYDTIRQFLITAGNIFWRSGSCSTQYGVSAENVTWNNWKRVDTTTVDYQVIGE